MKDIINAEIAELEKAEDIRIIHAVESGSRAWGFESPDSDYDVRFVYVRPVDHYLKLEEARDVIEWKLDDTWDISGWDLVKALRLLHGSNPTLIEWSNSPIIYRTTPDWAGVHAEIDQHFSIKAGLYHYLSMAKRTYQEQIERNSVALKKYFYVLRPLLACLWILHHQTPPPMPFYDLVHAELDPALKPVVDDLVAAKMSTSERGASQRIERLYLSRRCLSALC